MPISQDPALFTVSKGPKLKVVVEVMKTEARGEKRSAKVTCPWILSGKIKVVWG
jgi:hypothetical protein